jgi:hypothetical protein
VSLSASRLHTIEHYTDQECDVSIPKEICIVPRERVICYGVDGGRDACRIGFGPTGLWNRDIGGSLRHRRRVLGGGYGVDGNDRDGTRSWLGW